MNFQKVITDLYQERNQLNQAIAALETLTTTTPRAARRKIASRLVPINGRRKRHMTAAGRKAISRAAKARWAKLKAKAA